MKKRCQYIEKCCFFIRIMIIKNKYFMVFPDFLRLCVGYL